MIDIEMLLKLAIIWLCIDTIIIATGWYLIAAIRPRFPNWWRRVIVDVDEAPPDAVWHEKQLIQQDSRL